MGWGRGGRAHHYRAGQAGKEGVERRDEIKIKEKKGEEKEKGEEGKEGGREDAATCAKDSDL